MFKPDEKGDFPVCAQTSGNIADFLGFPGTGFANDDSNAIAGGDAVLQVAQRFLVLRRQQQEAAIRCQIEWPLSKAVELAIHIRDQPREAISDR